MAKKQPATINLHSRREYQIAMLESGADKIDLFTTTITDLLRSDDETYEYIYALQMDMDKILDLQVGQAMYFQPNRDDKATKGIIHRIK